MFKYIKYSGRDDNYFSLIDSCFTEKMEVDPRNPLYNHQFVEQIIDIYSRRKLNVIRNLRLFYAYLISNYGYNHEALTNLHFSTVKHKYNYRQKIYPLIKNH